MIFSPGKMRHRLALVDLDPRDDAFPLKQLDQRRAVPRRLADRLIEEDHPADIGLDVVGAEEQLAVIAAALLGRFELDGVEALFNRPGALVRGQDALAVGDQGPHSSLN